MEFAFISRHQISPEQHTLASEKGISLVYVGDADAFTVSPSFVDEMAVQLEKDFEGVIVVHPAAAMRLCGSYLVGVFEDASRPPVDGKPQFAAKALHVFDMRD